MKIAQLILLCGVLGHSVGGASEAGKQVPERYFGIHVLDSETGRGVPMVKLTTVSKINYITDSAGWIAFDEPGLMDREVYFEITSHGYHYPKDGFGNRGKVLRTKPGGSATINIVRDNIAERLYRVTGQGVYRDSWLLGLETAIAKPLLNGDVLGQDTVQTVVFRDKIHWFWGDTNRPIYPLGQFKTSGAVSELPSRGGLSPFIGIDLTYFVDEKGFSREMTPVPGPGAVWMHGLFGLRSDSSEQLFGHYSRVKTLGEQYEHGLLKFNERTQTFEKLLRFDDEAMLYPRGQALAYEQGIDDYIYFCRPFPSVRVKTTVDAIKSTPDYEAFTCLQEGARFQEEEPAIERDAAGRPLWAWKRNTDSLGARQMHALIDGGHLSKREARLCLMDGDDLIYVDSGSVHWNAFRHRWVMIAGQVGGENSFLGEIWYAESESFEGPWVHATRVVSHDKYSFYNPAHQPFFDQDGGRVIFFEGTYATTFSGAPSPTPRYDYNQIMYSVNLEHPQLKPNVTDAISPNRE